MTEIVLGLTSNYFLRLVFVVSLFALGLMVASFLDPQPKPMSRFLHGLITVFATALWSGAPGLWASVSAASVDAASGTYAAVMAIAGFLLAFAARRRSVDAYGDPRNAYMAAIPLINLVLIFKGPSTNRTSGRSIWMVMGRTLVFLALAFVAMMPGVFLQVLGKDGNIAPNLTNLQPERVVRIVALMNDAAAPAVLDRNTMLTGARSDGMTVELQYNVSGDVVELSSAETFKSFMLPTLQTATCADSSLRRVIDVGGAVRFKYDLMKRNGIETSTIEVTTC